MAKKKKTTEIDDFVENFVGELTDLVRKAGLEAVREALGDGPTPPIEETHHFRTRGPSRRSHTRVEALAARVLTRVKKIRGGQSCTELSAALKREAGDLKAPIKLLIADGHLKTTGQRRGMRYLIA